MGSVEVKQAEHTFVSPLGCPPTVLFILTGSSDSVRTLVMFLFFVFSLFRIVSGIGDVKLGKV